MNLFTQEKVLERLAISRQAFEQGIRPLMAREGDAQCLGTGRRATWVFDGAALWRWAEYIEKRRALIEIGRWSPKRPYSVEEMYALVDDGRFDGEIDHPAFRLAGVEQG